jgi:hypothetical protein
MARTGRGDSAAESRAGDEDPESAPKVVQAGGRSFHRLGDLFVDALFEEEMGERMARIEAYSESYFELLAGHPGLKSVFALGEHIILVLGNAAYEIVPPNKTVEGSVE